MSEQNTQPTQTQSPVILAVPAAQNPHQEDSVKNLILGVQTLWANFKTAILVAGAFLCFWVYQNGGLFPKREQAQPPMAAQVSYNGTATTIPPATTAPAPALMNGVAAVETLTFTVASTGSARDGRKFLNSQPQWRNPGNVSLELTGAGFASLDPKVYQGRSVSASGMVKHGANGSKTVVVSDPSQLKVQ